MPSMPRPLAWSRGLWLLCLCLALPATAGAAGEAPVPPLPTSQPLPVVVSANGLSSTRLSMLLQTDLRIPQRGAGLETVVVFRRARLQLDSTLADWVDARFVLGDLPVRESQFIKDAWLDFRFQTWLQLRVGKIKTPFGHEWLMTSSAHADFIENSLTFVGLVPLYGLGAVLHGKAWGGRGEYWVGYVNGESKSDGKLDGVDQRMLVSRVSFSPVKGLLLGASTTQSVGDRDRSWVPKWTAPTGYRFLEADAVSVRTPRSRLGAEAVFRQGPVSLKSEYVYLDALGDRQSNEEGTQGLWAQGFYASSTWVMTGEEKTERGVNPRNPFEPMGADTGLGAWELGIRYGRLESNLGSGLRSKNGDSPLRKVELQEATLGLNWYPNAYTRWTVNGSRYALGSKPEALLKSSSFHEVLVRMQLSF